MSPPPPTSPSPSRPSEGETPTSRRSEGTPPRPGEALTPTRHGEGDVKTPSASPAPAPDDEEKKPIIPPDVPKKPKEVVEFHPSGRLYTYRRNKEGEEESEPVMGTLGRVVDVKLRANTVAVRLREVKTTEDIFVWYRYTVNILPLREDKGGEKKKQSLPPKNILRRIWAEVEESEREAKRFGEVKMVYDGRSTAYASNNLPTAHFKFTINHPQLGRFSIALTDESCINPSSLTDYIKHAPFNYGEVSETLACLNTIFNHSVAQTNPHRKNVFYIAKPEEYKLDAKAHGKYPLDGGIELWRGFFSSIRPTCGRLILNVDTTSGAFVKSGSLVPFLLSCLQKRSDAPTSTVYARNISPTDRIRINRILAGCQVSIKAGGKVIVKGAKIKKDKGCGITMRNARDIDFDNRDTGTRMTVEDYWNKHYSVRLQYPELPCLQVRPGVAYPAELVEIDPGHKSNGKLLPFQQLSASAFQTLKPINRLDAISRLTSFDVDKSITSLAQPYAKPFNFQISPHSTLDKVLGRVLQAPGILYDNRQTSPCESGAWKMMRNKHKFYHGASFKSIAVIVHSEKDIQGAMQFLYNLFKGAHDLGMDPVVVDRPEERIVVQRAREAGKEGVAATIKNAVQKGGDHFRAHPEVIFWFFNGISEDYNAFKQEGLRLGIATQAIQAKNMRKGGDLQFIINVAMKLNAKLRGENFRLLAGSLGGKIRHDGWTEKNRTMVFGLDLTHVDNQPSLAAMVGSMDDLNLIYEEELTVQPLVEPPDSVAALDREARPKRTDIVQNLRAMTLMMLNRRFAYTKKLPPVHLLMIRSGVSEGEFPMILNKEVTEFKKAIEDFKKEHDCPKWEPKLIYLLAIKRHHIRLFGDARDDNKSVEGKSGNIPAGTVVDFLKICDPYLMDWYTAAHTGILGTTRPLHATILLDEHDPRLGPDDMQPIINALCHSYERCNRAVSVPAPVYYADLIAYKARSWLPLFESTSSDGASSYAGSVTFAPNAKHGRESIFKMSEDVLEDMKKGREVFRGDYDKRLKPAMWWL